MNLVASNTGEYDTVIEQEMRGLSARLVLVCPIVSEGEHVSG